MNKHTTRTGLVIGRAYTPKRDAAYGDAMPRTATRWTWNSRGRQVDAPAPPSMLWVAIFALFCFLVLTFYGAL
jgi:hypothetical protein